MLRVPTPNAAVPPQPDRSVLTPEIQSTLAALAEVEAHYESDQECLKGWSGPDAIRLRLLELLAARHVQEREPLVQRLAELHQQTVMASIVRRSHRR